MNIGSRVMQFRLMPLLLGKDLRSSNTFIPLSLSFLLLIKLSGLNLPDKLSHSLTHSHSLDNFALFIRFIGKAV